MKTEQQIREKIVEIQKLNESNQMLWLDTYIESSQMMRKKGKMNEGCKVKGPDRLRLESSQKPIQQHFSNPVHNRLFCMNTLIPKSISLIILGGILSLAFCIVCQPIYAVVSNETSLGVSETNSNLTQFSTYEDEDFGYTIQYPSSWNLTQDTTLNKVADFSSPEGDVDISVRVFPRIDNETLKDRGDELKNNSDFKIREYYRNSTTKLAGLPAILVSGSYFNTISVFEQALGYQSSITRTYQI